MFERSVSSWDEEDDDFWSLEGLKKASATLELHESASCSCLLPCGLLPEELAELEASTEFAVGVKAMALQVEQAAQVLSEQESEPAMPVTPPGRTRLAFRSSDGEDEGSTEDGDEVEEAGEPAAPGVAPPEPPATRG